MKVASINEMCRKTGFNQRMSPWYCPNHGFISDDLCVCSRGQRQPRVHHQHGCLHEVRQTLPKLQQWQCSLHNDNVLLPLSISLYLIFYVIFRCCTDNKILSNNSVLLLLSWLGVWLLRCSICSQQRINKDLLNFFQIVVIRFLFILFQSSNSN